MKIETKQELKYIMDYYDIPCVPVKNGAHDCGKITRDLRYEGGLYKFTREEYAFKVAFEQVKDVVELKERINQPLKTIQVLRKEYDEWMYPDKEGGEPRHHVYPRTAVKEEEEEIEGATMDEVFVKHYKANRSYRYCNGYEYHLKDKSIEKMYLLWLAIMPYGRSMDLYYGNGIVD